MATTTDPTALANAARCLACATYSVPQQLAILIWIAATNAGVTTDPTILAQNAQCIETCIPPGMLLPVLIWVTAQGGSGGGAGALQVTSGAANPVAAPSNPAIANLYVNTTTGVIWTWPAGGAAWQ